MPTVEDEFVEVSIFGNGKVIQTGKSWRCKEDGKCYYESITPELFFHATEISKPHGRLGDLDALEQDAQKRLLMCNKNDNQFQAPYEVMRAIALAPTIIPASEEE